MYSHLPYINQLQLEYLTFGLYVKFRINLNQAQESLAVVINIKLYLQTLNYIHSQQLQYCQQKQQTKILQ